MKKKSTRWKKLGSKIAKRKGRKHKRPSPRKAKMQIQIAAST